MQWIAPGEGIISGTGQKIAFALRPGRDKHESKEVAQDIVKQRDEKENAVDARIDLRLSIGQVMGVIALSAAPHG